METLETLLAEANRRAASEILLMAGDAPAMRAPGPWQRLSQARSTPAEMEALVRQLLSPEQWQRLQESREIELVKEMEGVGRVRCHVHFQRGSLVVIVRPVDGPDA